MEFMVFKKILSALFPNSAEMCLGFVSLGCFELILVVIQTDIWIV